MSTLRIRGTGTSGFAALALLSTGLLGACDRPPTDETQSGYRGNGMEQVTNPRTAAKLNVSQLANLPEIYPAEAPAGERAGDIYENLQLLGDLDINEFNRLMAAITAWVSPEEGCTYCHNPENLASDEVYTKVVARGMLKMTWEVNDAWDVHVAATGVTCYTCHRGQPIPAETWFRDTGPKMASGFAADRSGQNIAGAGSVAYASLPFDPFTPFLEGDQQIRVQGLDPLPPGGTRNIMDTERTYGLMMHLSDSLGVNCTYCHNSRAFYDWDQSSPQRMTAQYGIAMVRALNREHLVPLTPVFPEQRLGPHGDVAKVNCATCHQGVNKPLYGTQMLKDFPVLAAPPPAPEMAARAEAP